MYVLWGFSGSSAGKESTCNTGDPGSVPGLGRPAGERNWLPTPVFLPGEFHGQRRLGGYSPWGYKESDMTERLSIAQHVCICAYLCISLSILHIYLKWI